MAVSCRRGERPEHRSKSGDRIFFFAYADRVRRMEEADATSRPAAVGRSRCESWNHSAAMDTVLVLATSGGQNELLIPRPVSCGFHGTQGLKKTGRRARWAVGGRILEKKGKEAQARSINTGVWALGFLRQIV